MVYIDSSLLIKLYYPEPETPLIQKWIKNFCREILLTPLHEIEMTNAMSLKLFRAEITNEEHALWLKTFNADKRRGILKAVALDWPATFLTAIKLAKETTPRTGARSLDVLHVAAAAELSCEGFMTHDKRQASLAGEAGLKVLSL
jgi:predicted nucleic acid-binding protein